MNLQDQKASQEYILCHNTSDGIYKNKTNGIKLRSKYDCYEQREKSI